MIDPDIVKNATKKDCTRIAVLVQSVVVIKVFLGNTNYEYWISDWTVWSRFMRRLIFGPILK
ncbi:hypothetical protein BH23THE1_BH23THE1_31930 [soil metagenome]